MCQYDLTMAWIGVVVNPITKKRISMVWFESFKLKLLIKLWIEKQYRKVYEWALVIVIGHQLNLRSWVELLKHTIIQTIFLILFKYKNSNSN